MQGRKENSSTWNRLGSRWNSGRDNCQNFGPNAFIDAFNPAI